MGKGPEINNMATIQELATTYESPKTLNIADLEKVPVAANIEEREFTREDGTTFKNLIYTEDEKDYRVPVSVLKQLKALLEKKPKTTHFSVSKQGEGMKTEYMVFAE